ncbi:hypothetical protein Vretifemale_1460, partial [Volvox reticuliferus]
RSCCRPLAETCRNRSVAAPAGPYSAAAAAAAAAPAVEAGAPGGSDTPFPCGDSACWTLLAEELKPEVYNDAASASAGAIWVHTTRQAHSGCRPHSLPPLFP